MAVAAVREPFLKYTAVNDALRPGVTVGGLLPLAYLAYGPEAHI